MKLAETIQTARAVDREGAEYDSVDRGTSLVDAALILAEALCALAGSEPECSDDYTVEAGEFAQGVGKFVQGSVTISARGGEEHIVRFALPIGAASALQVETEAGQPIPVEYLLAAIAEARPLAAYAASLAMGEE